MKAYIATGLTLLALSTSAVARADGLNVVFSPGIESLSVAVTDTTNYARQNCGYTATPQQPTLLKPVSRTFTVPRAGTTTLVFPGVPTATVWDVRSNCDFIDVEATVGLDPPPPGSVATQMTY